MARNSASRWVRTGLLGASWAVAMWGSQALAGAELGGPGRHREKAIEEQLERGRAASPAAAPEHPRDDDSIEPWELVHV